MSGALPIETTLSVCLFTRACSYMECDLIHLAWVLFLSSLYGSCWNPSYMDFVVILFTRILLQSSLREFCCDPSYVDFLRSFLRGFCCDPYVDFVAILLACNLLRSFWRGLCYDKFHVPWNTESRRTVSFFSMGLHLPAAGVPDIHFLWRIFKQHLKVPALCSIAHRQLNFYIALSVQSL